MDIFLKRRHIFFTILLSVFLNACGYSTHAVLPSGDEASVHVDNFVNKIDTTRETSDENVYYAYLPNLEAGITREVIDRFIFDGNYQIKEEKEAQFLLKGQLVKFQREPLRYDANDNVIEYRISIAVNMELYDSKKKVLLWKEQNFAGESTYRTTGEYSKSESAAVNEAKKDLARRIVERTVENW